MARRINFINPFGTQIYDQIILDTLSHYRAEGTELVITHLDGCPADMDYFYPKHLVESALLEAIMRAQDDGFDAVISGCCYDPGVAVGRELVDIPVVGPMEASLQMSAYFGRSVAIVTDHRKPCEYMRDHALVLGFASKIRGYDVIDWFIRDMVNDKEAVARDIMETASRIVEKTNAEAIILNCTVVAACYQAYLIAGGKPAEVPIINPNLMALKMAETLADLRQKNAYAISRVGYYQQPRDTYFKDLTAASRRAWLASKDSLRKSFNET
jgi:Asp/Glu/hydantoin racemase